MCGSHCSSPSLGVLLWLCSSVSPLGLVWSPGGAGMAVGSPWVHDDSDSCTVTVCASIWRCRLSISCLGRQEARKEGMPVKEPGNMLSLPRQSINMHVDPDMPEWNLPELDSSSFMHLWHLQGPTEPLWLGPAKPMVVTELNGLSKYYSL